ncbi:MAG: TIGR03899 family protein [Ferrimonas sp.]
MSHPQTPQIRPVHAPIKATVDASSTAHHAGNNSISGYSSRTLAIKLSHGIGLGREGALLAERLAWRQKQQHEQYQQNLEGIVKQALIGSNNNTQAHELDPDWWHRFQQLAEQIHNPQMQRMWGKILATEMVQPRSFSLKALETLMQMNHRDAQTLTDAVAICGFLEQDPTPLIITGYRTDAAYGGFLRSTEQSLALTVYGLPYSAVLTLKELGLLHAVELETSVLPNSQLSLQYGAERLQMQCRHPRLHLRYYRFSHTGQELARLVECPPNNDYIAHLKQLAPKAIVWF